MNKADEATAERLEALKAKLDAIVLDHAKTKGLHPQDCAADLLVLLAELIPAVIFSTHPRDYDEQERQIIAFNIQMGQRLSFLRALMSSEGKTRQ